ncbi:MAG: ABC transporter ATP-binding protein [Candidatus Korarchaeum sp.]|nr:ABC transporter ATP-binding protein [Candidatus Korarchaeum sp.]MDW8035393.1 ABC transporter ATP-binding protein [Candidatus Korarchaeum sp.]
MVTGESSVIFATEKLTKKFGGLYAVNGVSIEVNRRSITMIMGPNGSGKTTLINVCSGILKPDEGRVFFDGREITGWPPHKIYRVGFIRTFQIPSPFLKLSVLENVLVSMRNKGENPMKSPIRPIWIREEEENIRKAFSILKRVGLDDLWDREAFKLGGGQLKMLEVARALASGAKLIALDEPIGGVDPSYANEILGYLSGLRRDLDITFLLIEHRIDIALPFADYVYVMDRGTVISRGSPEEVSNDPRVIEVYLG